MTGKSVRGPVLAGCVVMMFFPQARAAVLARNVAGSSADPCSAEQVSYVAAPSAQAPFFGDLFYVRPYSIAGSPGTPSSAINFAEAAAPWSPRNFVLIATDRTCSPGPVGVRPSADGTAKAESATLAVGIPGAVTNLRRTDQR